MARIIDGKYMNVVGDTIKEYRHKRKMSQQALSNKLELLGVYVCRGSVSRIEDKTRTVTDIELYAIAKVLDIPWSELSPDKQFS
ncbi:MAG: helix-turn-helix transcriptional regulator [Oscillospiraceae bacterium]|nr:helix-turn-helix transcriptional regulator [Oscillospiraceae bacterium]